MRQWKLLVALAMFLAFIAGAVIGLGRSRMGRPTDGDWRSGPPEVRLANELGLSDDQREKIRQIWEGLMQDGPRDFDRRWEIESQYRSEAEALLTPEQKRKYDAIVAEGEKKLAEVDREHEAKFAGAIDRTKALLTPEQREKYDEIMSRHRGPGGMPGGPPPPHGGGPGFGPKWRGPGGPGHHGGEWEGHGPPPGGPTTGRTDRP